MPKDDSPQVSRDYSFRHSLQPKSGAEAPILRHTQSQNYGAKKKRVKTVPPPAIPELEVADGDKGAARTSVDVVNEHVKLAVENDKKRHSRASRKNSQGVDNAGFEMEAGGRISRGNSAASSVRSSMRDPSITSVVVHEQYCCCSRWSPFERVLCAAVGVLIFVVLILVITVILLAVRSPESSKKAVFSVFGLN
ncbi:uncharacterized protein LOC103314819 isoform X2 [Tribolium castaneum]|uniref:uncharacterized protein LOC103314819 isoform X2 n=1 Tax=Tribolium castaneum TaxID=7070 RepID=UPI00077DAC22|nr:PREDICTED: uncharacterized protein LOC103314819 isoform X2 [Tribolium castaneum]|eukprot:XP_015834185.1 PREDICTED: uncharacterized protein LOC103314819 isoform X2 [Tribolium castaneum]